MKKLILIIPFLILATTNICGQDQQVGVWQNDLDYLVRRIEIMHPDPYAFFPKQKFYRLTQKLHQEISGLTDAEIVVSISELLATLQDGHTRWALDKTDPQWLQQNLHLLPLILYAFKDGIYVMAGLQQYENLVGLKVLQIGIMPIHKVTAKLSVLMSHDNPSGKKKYLY